MVDDFVAQHVKCIQRQMLHLHFANKCGPRKPKEVSDNCGIWFSVHFYCI